MQRLGTHVTLIEHNRHVMFRQLDAASGNLLAAELESLNIDLKISTSVRMVLGTTRVEGVLLSDGSELPCDTLVVATGIKPNIDLGRDAGLAVGRGIRVNGQMQTSDNSIYAAGECCEFDGHVFGTVAPGYEQAAIVANNVQTRSDTSEYRSTVLATSLKLLGLSVVSIGESDPTDPSIRTHVYQADGLYRRLNIFNRSIVGVVAIGDWPALVSLREHLKQGQRLMPWTLARFRKNGELWEQSATDAATWPAAAIICSCNSVSKAQIELAINQGCDSVESLGANTLSGTICGTCKPLLQSLLGTTKPQEPVKLQVPALVVSSCLAVALTFGLFAPSVPYTDTVQLQLRWDLLWTNSTFKQCSGFALFGFAVIGLLLSARKRLARVKIGHIDYWRFIHVATGALCVVALVIHTGFRFGSNLNFYLMSTFTALSVVGVVLSLVIAVEHRLQPAMLLRLRQWGMWAHLALCWPVPALLSFHVLKTYYF